MKKLLLLLIASALLFAACKKKKIAEEEKDYYTGLSKALNQHTKLIVLNAEKDKIIASIVHEFVETIIETETELSYSAGIEQILLFGDGSKLSLESFGKTGFDALIKDLI